MLHHLQMTHLQLTLDIGTSIRFNGCSVILRPRKPYDPEALPGGGELRKSNHVERSLFRKGAIMKGMRIAMKVTCLFFAGLLVLAGAWTADAQKVLKVGMNADSPPFGYMEKGTLVGMEIDLYTEVAKRMGAKIDITNLPFAGIFPGLQAGKWDVAGNTWIKKERIVMMDFSDPWIRATLSFAVRKESNIKSMADLKGRAIGVQAGSADHAWLDDNQSKFGPYTVKTYDRSVDQLNDLLGGRIQAVARDQTRLLFQIKEMPELHVPFTAGNEFMQAAAFRKGDALCNEFNKIQNDMKRDGTLAAIYKKWLGVSPGPEEPPVKIYTKPYEPLL
jgi:polar amino acid transport system substrate-binding protein